MKSQPTEIFPNPQKFRHDDEQREKKGTSRRAAAAGGALSRREKLSATLLRRPHGVAAPRGRPDDALIFHSLRNSFEEEKKK